MALNSPLLISAPPDPSNILGAQNIQADEKNYHQEKTWGEEQRLQVCFVSSWPSGRLPALQLSSSPGEFSSEWLEMWPEGEQGPGDSGLECQAKEFGF